jgi:hypothetical protein
MEKQISTASVRSYETQRQILNEKILKDRYTFDKLESDDALKSTGRYCMKYYKPSRTCFSNYMLDRIPFLRWIRQYDPKECLLKDIIAGLTIGIVHIPVF